MIHTLAIANYRSLLQLVVPLGRLTVITGANGSGKSNLYRALRLLAETANGGVIGALAREGGLDSAFWAGPEKLSKAMRSGEARVQGGPRSEVVRLRLGFAGEDFGYSIALGLPSSKSGYDEPSYFRHDPEIKHECIWAGPYYRPAGALVDRSGSLVKVKDGRSWAVLAQNLNDFDSILSEVADPGNAPEIFSIRNNIKAWRFYDNFRTDRDAPPRFPQIGTRTPVLDHQGHDLAAALQTIREIGNAAALDEAIADAFPGARLRIAADAARFSVELHQHGLLRPLAAAELSDGTLRYLLLVAALLTPRPPALMVLNEPETSLHPDLLPALARLIVNAAAHSQVWVVSHSARLVAALREYPACQAVELEKELGQTLISGQRMLDAPAWHWPDKA